MSYRLLRDSHPVARKQHKCVWCGESIPPGETYRHEQSIYDGEFQNHKWHLECDEDAQDYFRYGDDEFMPFSNERPPKKAREPKAHEPPPQA